MNEPLETTASQVSPLRGYVQVIVRRKYLVLAVYVAFVVSAMAISYLITPKYTSTAQLRYQRDADISSALSGSTSYVTTADAKQAIETAAQLINVAEVQALAAEQLGLPGLDNVDATVSAALVPDTSLLSISATSPDPKTAAAVANAYAAAFLAWRRQAAVDEYTQAQNIIEEKLSGYRTAREQANPGYAILQQRLQDVLTLKALAHGDFRDTAAAQVSSVPSSPKHGRDLMIALGLGLVFSIAVAFVAEQLDVRVHDADDISRSLGVPVLARIPAASRELTKGDRLASLDQPEGLHAEAFRILRGNLEFADVDREVHALLVTSCSAGEGKTSTACNLAVTLARAGQRVIVIDADLRRPRLHRYFNLSNDAGVTSVVSGRLTVDEALQHVPVPEVGDLTADDALDEPARGRLDVLPSGAIPPNPGEILHSRRFRELMGDLKERADLVLVDTGPFMAVGDAATLSAYTEGVLLVMRIGRVTRSMLKEARALLNRVPSRAVGVVVTNQGGYYRYHYYQTESTAAAAPALDS